MEVAALKSLFRSDVRDVAVPYLWSDTEVWSYIDEAQNQFCRLRGGIADAGSELPGITRLFIDTGDRRVALSSKVLEIREARSYPTGRIVNVVSVEDARFRLRADDYGFNLGSSFNPRPGPVRSLVIGESEGFLRLADVPTEPTVIDLSVFRLPLVGVGSDNDVLEIDHHHHRSLLYWMKHLAHQKQDAETFDRGRSQENMVLFMAYCEEARFERSQNTTVRAPVAYGGY